MPSHADTVRVGVCISGSVRTLLLPCTGKTAVENVITPLGAEVFVSVNVHKEADLAPATAGVQQLLAGAKLIELDVHVYRHITTTCDALKGATVGLPQSMGLRQCGEWMLPRNYDWIIRLRTDTWLPFIIHNLPSSSLYGGRGTAITGAVDSCQRCTDELHCASDTLCGCTNDQIALLAGSHAQHAFLVGSAGDYCRPMTPIEGLRSGVGYELAECKLGWSLASRGVPARDLRFASCHWQGQDVIRDVTIIRDAKGCLDAQNRTPFKLTAASLAAIPAGPWNPRRQQLTCGTPDHRKVGYLR